MLLWWKLMTSTIGFRRTLRHGGVIVRDGGVFMILFMEFAAISAGTFNPLFLHISVTADG